MPYTPDAPDAAETPAADESVPWQQSLYESIWVWAAVAIVFWFLSYVIWGVVDLISIPPG